ncbi:hypothetical protein RvY_08800 [Ramazzottius varieornatus]|uniref:Uncharacterized protein n=1 Tax=Ramazzottius varieornatus TaxID=947166 RepID=A0A1D1V752_RAMVA|nr:hypothetical protein RvY_08800 [Ramazzottius varieornatus]
MALESEDILLPVDNGPATDNRLCDPHLSPWPLENSVAAGGEHVWVPFSFTHVEYVKGKKSFTYAKALVTRYSAN